MHLQNYQSASLMQNNQQLNQNFQNIGCIIILSHNLVEFAANCTE